MSDSEKRKDGRVPVAMRVKLRYPDVDAFIERYSANISKGGIFIISKNPKPAGTLLRFELTLADSTKLVRGEGKVVWIKEFDPEAPKKPHGMGLKFTKLDAESKALILRVLEYKKKKKEAATQAEDGAEPTPEKAETPPPAEPEAKPSKAEDPAEPEPKSVPDQVDETAEPEPEPEPDQVDETAEPEPETVPEKAEEPAEPEPQPEPETVPEKAEEEATVEKEKKPEVEPADSVDVTIPDHVPERRGEGDTASDADAHAKSAERPRRLRRRPKAASARLSGDVQELLQESEDRQDLVKATMARLKKRKRPALDDELEALIGDSAPAKARKPLARRRPAAADYASAPENAAVAADATDPQPIVEPAELDTASAEAEPAAHETGSSLSADTDPQQESRFAEPEPSADESPPEDSAAPQQRPSAEKGDLDGVLEELEGLDRLEAHLKGEQDQAPYEPAELDAEHMSAQELQTATQDLDPLPEEARPREDSLEVVVVDTTDIQKSVDETPERDDYRGEPIMPKPPPPPPAALEAQGLDADSLEGLDEALGLDSFEPSAESGDTEFERPAVAEPGGEQPAAQQDVKFEGDDEEVESDLNAALQNLQNDNQDDSTIDERGAAGDQTVAESVDDGQDEPASPELQADQDESLPTDEDQPEEEGDSEEPKVRGRKKSFFKRIFGK